MSEKNLIDPVQMAELYARSPSEITDEDFRLIIADLRERREKFIVNNDKKIGSGKPKSAAAQKTAALSAVQISIDL